ncbi:MAG: FliM/FliN family flagellar motor switch protein, partial [Gammaproteobacteria bacterium]|nr:FliM/FliN family flagellar motor switch protein [Gammaproteobacteria bacterium]
MSDEENTTDVDDVWGEALQEQAAEEAVVANKASFSEVVDDSLPETDVNLEVVLDIPVNISMEIGRTKISIRNLLQLNQGS